MTRNVARFRQNHPLKLSPWSTLGGRPTSHTKHSTSSVRSNIRVTSSWRQPLPSTPTLARISSICPVQLIWIFVKLWQLISLCLLKIFGKTTYETSHSILTFASIYGMMFRNILRTWLNLTKYFVKNFFAYITDG